MIVAPEAPSQSPTKRIAVFLDGTWNTVNDNTNVWRLKSLLAPTSSDGKVQLVYYGVGVGTAFGERLRGGMFGYGLNEEIIRAYEWLIDQYDDGDELFIFGFSRGAYTARSLSGLITKYGLLTAGAPLSVGQLYARYRRASEPPTIRDLLEAERTGSTANFTLEERWMVKYSQPIDVKFIGVWDTVGALGLPFGNLPILGKKDMQFLHTGIRKPNKHAFHALAIDEHRAAFAPTLWTVDVPKEKANDTHGGRTVEEVEQRWFVGAHANVGGGCQSDVLAQTPLKWIMDKAVLHGLAFRRDVEIDKTDAAPTISDSYSEFMSGAYKVATRGKRFYRPIGAAPEESSATQVRKSINETIDATVFERWRADATYRPPNLVDWVKRRGVGIDAPTTAVRADTLESLA